MPRRCLFLLPFLLALGWWLTDCPAAQAAKFIVVRIERDGKVLLEGSFGADDSAEPSEVWDHLKRTSLKGAEPLVADAADPQQATLTGDLRITISWVKRPVASAQVDQLRLVRVSGTTDQWLLPREEVERTSQAAGLPPYRSAPPLWVFAGVVVVVGLLGAAVVWVLVKRRKVMG